MTSKYILSFVGEVDQNWKKIDLEATDGTFKFCKLRDDELVIIYLMDEKDNANNAEYRR